MKIGVINLPYDNNYGGNLQRYALVKTLQDLGHTPEHIQIRFNPPSIPLWKKNMMYLKRLIIKALINKKQRIFVEEYEYQEYIKSLDSISCFYDRFIPHTHPCYSLNDLRELQPYDIYIIGSDQVWRKKIANKYLGIMMGEGLPDNARRIAYAISFGTEDNELSTSEIRRYALSYKKFSAVSVREQSGLRLLDSYGWTNPQAIHLLDPVFLLDKDDYIKIISIEEISLSDNFLFCYILDESKEKQKLINDISLKTGFSKHIVSLNCKITIEGWLRELINASFVITDSFHGLAFSILFNKPYKLIRNQSRGNTRFDSILQTFGLSEDGSNVDWKRVNEIIKEYRKKSINFLIKQLN